MWCNSGYGDLGMLAEQISVPRRTFPRAIAILLPFSILVATFPFIAGEYICFFLLRNCNTLHLTLFVCVCCTALSWEENPENYNPGYFGTLAHKHIGGWMQVIFVCGGILAIFGGYLSNTVIINETLQYISEKSEKIATRIINSKYMQDGKE